MGEGARVGTPADLCHTTRRGDIKPKRAGRRWGRSPEGTAFRDL